MRYSHLLSSVLYGKWLILPQSAFSQEVIVDRLLSRQYDPEIHSKVLSESKPFSVLVGMSETGAKESLFDSVPEESTAIINLSGTMLKYGTWCGYGTTEIAEALLKAGRHQNIGSIVLNIDSGGGAVDSIAPLADAILEVQALGKSVVASVDLCASAAYFVACHCDEIIAGNNISAEIGSIGVMMSFMDRSKYYEKEGVVRHVIYSNLSEYKNRPFELALKRQYDEIKTEELDPLARSFQDTVRSRRGDKLKEETPGILQGRMFFAGDAKENGLIDRVASMDVAINRAREIRETKIIEQYINS
ncbi:MAG: S49 family peptidase [Candidatus Symbiothrix sp.]|jgi:protease-4|nr:S49 family peptidase [Candidatus Symbiothrix sp.]